MVDRKRLFVFTIDGLQQVTDAGLLAQGLQQRKAARRADLVSKAKDFIHAHLTEQISADYIAQALGVSYRVRNYALVESLGVSPYQNVLSEKLHAVRRHLKSPGASVSESCFAYGFETSSRFTRQYARLFGELPSETRKQIGGRLSFSREDKGV